MHTVKKLLHKFDRWLSYHPPWALSAQAWALFEKEFKEKAPVRHWIKHTSRRWRNAVRFKVSHAAWWIRHRTTDRFHVIKTGLPPGFVSVDEQMLHASFTVFKDFVELEKCRSAFSDTARSNWKRRFIPLYNIFKPFRDIESALRQLEWETTLDDPACPPDEQCIRQAQTAREIIALYLWWTKTRPNRALHPIPEYCDQAQGSLAMLSSGFDKTAPDYVEYRRITELNDELEESWNEEDDRMLERLVKIRSQLWS